MPASLEGSESLREPSQTETGGAQIEALISRPGLGRSDRVNQMKNSTEFFKQFRGGSEHRNADTGHIHCAKDASVKLILREIGSGGVYAGPDRTLCVVERLGCA